MYTDQIFVARQTFKYGEIHVVEEAIDIAYLNTSTALLNLLKTKYKLMDHLKAMKRYLLLGQGDFIQYLMDILGLVKHYNYRFPYVLLMTCFAF